MTGNALLMRGPGKLVDTHPPFIRFRASIKLLNGRTSPSCLGRASRRMREFLLEQAFGEARRRLAGSQSELSIPCEPIQAQ